MISIPPLFETDDSNAVAMLYQLVFLAVEAASWPPYQKTRADFALGGTQDIVG